MWVDPCRTLQAHFRSSLPLIATVTTLASASPPSLQMLWRPALLGRFCRERDTLARTVMRVTYITLSFAVMPFLFVQPLVTYVLIIGQDEAFVQVSKLRRSVLSHN